MNEVLLRRAEPIRTTLVLKTPISRLRRLDGIFKGGVRKIIIIGDDLIMEERI